MNDPEAHPTIHDDDESHRPGDRGRPHFVVVQFNDEPVRFERGAELTGLEVKQTAIAQGVDIKIDYALSVLHHGGHGHQVGDTDTVKITEHIEFSAIPGDDNS